MTSAILAFLQGVLPAASLALMKRVVDAAVIAVDTRTSSSTQDLFILIAAWFLIQLSSGLLGDIQRLVSSLQADLLANHVSVMLFEKANTLPLAHFESAETYDKLSLAQRDASHRPGLVVESAFNLFRSGLTVITVAGVLASISWWLVLVIAIVALPMLAIELHGSNQRFALWATRAADQRRLGYLSTLLTTDSPVKELRIFGLHDILLDRYRRIFRDFYNANRALSIRVTRFQILASVISTITAAASYLYVATETIAGRVTVGGLIVYHQAYQQTQGAMSQLAYGIASLYEHGLFLSNLYAFLDTEGEDPSGEETVTFPTEVKHGIRFNNVGFTYPGTDRVVLDNVSFEIRPGEIVALAGANGAGKTTIVKLLSRLYAPTSGSITIDGLDFSKLTSRQIQRRIGIIFQDFQRYQFTLGENIGFGWAEHVDNSAEICRATHLAGLEPVVDMLPHGYMTPLGRWFHDGQELSLGQWQKVALARGFMCPSDLLILDEPTASLDARSEFALGESLQVLRPGRMILLISHRLSTLRLADRVIVVDQGRIVEQGTHDHLIATHGHYANLFVEQQIVSSRDGT